jgi:hypothetical protein
MPYNKVYASFFRFFHIGRHELRRNKIHDILSRLAVSQKELTWLVECNQCL